MKIAAGVCLLLALEAVPAWAVLGEYENSVESDRAVMRGQVRTIARQGFSLREITSRDRMVVREYVSPEGRVFGITWNGPVMPNLQQLLGSYFSDFQQAAQSKARPRGPLVIRTDRLIIESGGHMRSFHGRAIVPSLLPHNISFEAVR